MQGLGNGLRSRSTEAGRRGSPEVAVARSAAASPSVDALQVTSLSPVPPCPPLLLNPNSSGGGAELPLDVSLLHARLLASEVPPLASSGAEQGDSALSASAMRLAAAAAAGEQGASAGPSAVAVAGPAGIAANCCDRRAVGLPLPASCCPACCLGVPAPACRTC